MATTTIHNVATMLPSDFAATVPGYATATSAQQNRLRALAALALGGARALGLSVLYVTSWLRDTGGGTHRDGAAVDITGPTKELTFRLWVWLAQNRRDQIGEVIYEQPKTGNTGHVHLTLKGWGGDGQVLYQDPGTGGFLEIDPFLLGHIRHADPD